jgi:hypothetical protein
MHGSIPPLPQYPFRAWCIVKKAEEQPYIYLYIHLSIYNNISLYYKSHDSSFSIALGYGLDDRGSRVRFPVGDGNFSLHHHVQNGSRAHPASYPMDTRGSFPGVEWPGHEADHSPPSSAKVKNAWSYTSTPPIRLHGVVLS